MYKNGNTRREGLAISKFTGEKCLFCTERFGDTDDVVVCPECGTPHHRSCYAENGFCANAERHAEGFEWRSRLADLIDALEAREARDSREFGEEAGERDGQDGEQNKKYETRDVFGVSRAELAAYTETPAEQITVGGNIKKISVNIFAGLLAPFYQYYKGMRLLGAFLTVPAFIISAPELLYGVKLPQPHQFFANMFITAQMVLLALFHNYIYLRFCAYKIKKIRRLFPEGGQNYYKELSEQGKPRVLRALADAFAVVLSLTIAAYFIKPV